MKSFHANHVSISQDDGYFTLGLADDELDPIDFIILTRASQTSTDIAVVVNETDEEFFDVISSVRYFDMQLVIELDSSLRDELDYGTLHIDLQNQPDQFVTSLQKFFSNTTVNLSTY